MDHNNYKIYRDQRFLQGEEDYNNFISMCRSLGIKIKPNTKILDFGCGTGGFVYYLRKKGFLAFGTDTVNRYLYSEFLCNKNKLSMSKEKIFKTIDKGNYKIPFNNTFDIVYSNQILEHVKNLRQTISETNRVLKSGGVALHIYPSRYRIIEGHTYIPFASLIQNYYYLLFWAKLGIRNEYQKNLNARETALKNYYYLRNKTSYPRHKEIEDTFQNYFRTVSHVESALIENNINRAILIKKIFRVIPIVSKFYGRLYGLLRHQIVLLKK